MGLGIIERNHHRLDTPTPLTDTTCICGKLKSVAWEYMDSVALQTKNRCIFTQLRCAYSTLVASASTCTHCWHQCTQSNVDNLLLLGQSWFYSQYKVSSLGVSSLW